MTLFARQVAAVLLAGAAWLAAPFSWAADSPMSATAAPVVQTCGQTDQVCCDVQPRCAEAHICVSKLCAPGVPCPPGTCVALKGPKARDNTGSYDIRCSATEPCAKGVCFHGYCMPEQAHKTCHNQAGCDSLRKCVKRPTSAEMGTCEYEGGLFQTCTAEGKCNSGGICQLGQCLPPAMVMPSNAPSAPGGISLP